VISIAHRKQITIPPFEKGGLGGICGRLGNAMYSNPPQSPFSPARGTPVGTPLLRSDPSAAKGGRFERHNKAAFFNVVFWMNKLWWVLLLIAQPALGAELPRPDHIVIVIEENKSFNQIIDNREAPYINKLAKRGALFTQSYGITHPSQPNYLALFSGSTRSITSNACPLTLSGDNLASLLQAKGLSFTSYSEAMPEAGYDGCIYGAYRRKHNPAANWKELATSNQPFSTFPADYTQLPTVAFVVPDQLNDMHDGSIERGDAWLKENIGQYAQWAMKHNSLLIVTWDEDNGSSNNRIATIFVGAMVKPGQYKQRINHYNLLRTIEEIYALPKLGESTATPAVKDVWK
jgi:phosphatidylinositol-3-phosphatase